MNIEHIYRLYKETNLVDTDTRKIRQNSLFFALKGDNFNGNLFAEIALKKGAKYAIVDEKLDGFSENENIFLVNDVLTCLQQLAHHHRNELNIPIIALTGSNGKTTTKELINCVLEKKYKTLATLGNLNNHIGVPLTLLSIDNDTEIGIIEMGANHPNEIAFLTDIVAPDFGYITNFGKAHLEGFGSVEGVIKAKSELYDYVITNNKTLFVNPKDPIQLSKTVNANRILFHKDLSFEEVNPFVVIKYKNTEVTTNLIGNYNYNNIAAAITIGLHFKVNSEDVLKAISNYIPTNNRSQIINTTSNKIILDAYNANPSSMCVAVENLSLLQADKKTLFLGDMFELGKDSLKEHQQIVDLVTKLGFDNVYFIGENFYKTTTLHQKFKNLENLITKVNLTSIQNTTILIKGSRGMALEKIVPFIN